MTQSPHQSTTRTLEVLQGLVSPEVPVSIRIDLEQNIKIGEIQVNTELAMRVESRIPSPLGFNRS